MSPVLDGVLASVSLVDGNGNRCPWPENPPEGYRVRVEWAVGATEPVASSGAWQVAGYLSEPGQVLTTPQQSGATVWIRVRGEAPQRRPSAWAPSQSIVMPTVGQLLSANLFLSGAIPTVSWTEGFGTGGVRIERSIGAIGHTASYSLETEVPSGIGVYTFPSSNVADGQEIYVRLTPFTGFSGSAVTGDAGTALERYAFRQDSETPNITGMSAARVAAGDCAGTDDYLTHRVSWFTDGDTTGWEIDLRVSVDGGPFDLLASSLPTADTYDHVLTGFEHDFDAGVRRDYRYRIELVRIVDGSIPLSQDASVLSSWVVACP